MKFTKKPVTIDAVQWDGNNLQECKKFLGESFGRYSADRHPGGRQDITVLTLEGSHIASRGDYLIRGVKGECYPCKPDIFEATYLPGIPCPKPMEVFIDCEWNGYGGALITMALVAMDGRELYLAVPLYVPIHPWVAENVLPVLGDVPCCDDRVDLALKIGAFLRPYTAVHLIADWPEDIERFCHALITGPGICIDTPPITMEVRRDLESVESAIPHNALEDARAIRSSYLSLMGDA